MNKIFRHNELRKARLKAGLSQEQFIVALSNAKYPMSRGTYSKLESGKCKKLDFNLLDVMARILGVSLFSFICLKTGQINLNSTKGA